MPRSLCIIPARVGSKRIPKKNIKLFRGKPIIAYSIEVAIASELFDEVMVSTDAAEIAEIARNFGAKVPFYRSSETANDTASTMSVLEEVVNNYASEGRTFDSVCCLYATAPLVQTRDLIEGRKTLEATGSETVLPVVRFSYPIWRGLKRLEDGTLRMVWPETLRKRTQDLETVYHDAGQWYWIAASAIGKPTFKSDCKGIEVSEEFVQDIDSPSDWTLAEIKYEQLVRLGMIPQK